MNEVAGIWETPRRWCYYPRIVGRRRGSEGACALHTLPRDGYWRKIEQPRRCELHGPVRVGMTFQREDEDRWFTTC